MLTFPFAWRRRLAQDGALLGSLSRIFVKTVSAFYTERVAREGADGAKTGAVTFIRRTSSDMRLNPHLHTLVLDGAYTEQGADLVWQGLGHLKTAEVGEVLERAVRRIERYLRRSGLIRMDDDVLDEDAAGEPDPETRLAASAVSGRDATGRTAMAVRSAAPGAARARLRQAALRVARRVLCAG